MKCYRLMLYRNLRACPSWHLKEIHRDFSNLTTRQEGHAWYATTNLWRRNGRILATTTPYTRRILFLSNVRLHPLSFCQLIQQTNLNWNTHRFGKLKTKQKMLPQVKKILTSDLDCLFSYYTSYIFFIFVSVAFVNSITEINKILLIISLNTSNNLIENFKREATHSLNFCSISKALISN